MTEKLVEEELKVLHTMKSSVVRRNVMHFQ